MSRFVTPKPANEPKTECGDRFVIPRPAGEKSPIEKLKDRLVRSKPAK